MQNPRLAARYAKSLLDLAVEQNQLEPTLKDIQLLHAICSQSRDFVSMLRSPIIKADKKASIIDAVVGSQVSTLTKAFINLMVNKGRESNMPEIADAFISQYKQMKNISIVTLTTATPVADVVKEAIAKKLTASLPAGTEVELKEKVDPEIIGGFVLQMGDKLFDASIRRDLNDVKAQFQKNIYVSQLN
ncbi:MAG: ATP synthase F1 subunit delta [Sphingobacteriales bacterium]|nr:MAG: ATP synthase F1 subunit delta [Sphingobacteriales bacterium]